ncbi:MAG: hypothetical protein OXG24_12640 [Gammaproteobacteria bacterium]|nr:hypothetical protein [Gammaproteobacteria bacterium]
MKFLVRRATMVVSVAFLAMCLVSSCAIFQRNCEFTGGNTQEFTDISASTVEASGVLEVESTEP